MDNTNVLVIMTDELRRDTLGCYGNEIVQTPHIDALANLSCQCIRSFNILAHPFDLPNIVI